VQLVEPCSAKVPEVQATGATVVVAQLLPAGHVTQEVAPAKLYSPAAQPTGLALPTHLEPAGHWTQLCLSAATYSPAEQATGDAVVEGHLEPAGHGVQDVADPVA
jgi:hypothetical protein